MNAEFTAEELKLIEEYFAFHNLIGMETNIKFRANKKVKKPIEKLQNGNIELSFNLEELKKELLLFEGCGLKRFAQNLVFGEGVKDAKFMIIGEAPGEEEDINGVPFCGRSGKLLEAALRRFDIKREKNCFITNSVFWRPPANRKPEKEELASCRPFLERMIKIIKPELIIAVGMVSVQNACGKDGKDLSFADVKNKELKFQFLHERQEEFKVVAVYHPSYLLRSPLKKRDFYIDMLKIFK